MADLLSMPISEYDFALQAQKEASRQSMASGIRNFSNAQLSKYGSLYATGSEQMKARIANLLSDQQLGSSAFNLGVQNGNDKNYRSLLESQNTTNAWLGGTKTALQGISTIGGLVMSVKNYEMQRDALKKQSELIDEQISASRESRAQRKAELARLNNVRSNTNQMFNNSAVVSRSY